MSGVSIKAFGYAVPKNSVPNDFFASIVETTDEWITTRTGIRNRYISTSENTSDLCSAAAQNILKNAGMSPAGVDLIIVATYTPDYAVPSTACIVQHKIGATRAFAFDISAACAGFVYALSVAEKFLRAGTYKNALVMGAEVQSKKTDWTDRSTCILLGDGAGGVLLTQDDTCAADGSTRCFEEDLHSDGEKSQAITCGFLPPLSEIKNEPKTLPYVKLNGREVFDFAIAAIPLSIERVLKKANISLEQVKYIVPHQANARIIEAIAKKMKVDVSKFYLNLNAYGNTSSASIPIAMAEMNEKGFINAGSGDYLVLTGFGGGLTWGTILMQL